MRSITLKEMDVEARLMSDPPSELGRKSTVCSPIFTAVSVTSEAAMWRLVVGQTHFALFVVT
jgi:hypothetical protein